MRAMSYAAAIDGLFSLAGELHARPGTARRKFRLEDMRVLLAELGDPQLRFPAVLIAGTNGKGSTAATLASILACAGYRTGLYTSPHLSRVNERVRVLGPGCGDETETHISRAAASSEDAEIHGRVRCGAPGVVVGPGEIGDDDFARLYFRVDEAAACLVAEGRLPDHSSFFETVTALAFLHFAAAAVDIAVLEVGMGGRLDATNVVDPLLSVITDISLDHTEWLGPTIDAIAREKAGILRPGGVMVTLPQHPEANRALGEVAVALGVRGVNAAEYVPAEASGDSGRNRYSLRVMDETIQIDSPLAGRHQQRNLALAVAAAVELCNNRGYRLSAADIATGVRDAVWPGRLERISGFGADVLLDVAHNPAGAWALRAALSAMDVGGSPPARQMTLVFGCLRDKAVSEMAQILFPIFDRVIVTEVDSPRTATLDELMSAAAPTGAAVESSAVGPLEALALAREITPPSGLIVVSGSVFLVGKVRAAIMAANDTEQKG